MRYDVRCSCFSCWQALVHLGDCTDLATVALTGHAFARRCHHGSCHMHTWVCWQVVGKR